MLRADLVRGRLRKGVYGLLAAACFSPALIKDTLNAAQIPEIPAPIPVTLRATNVDSTLVRVNFPDFRRAAPAPKNPVAAPLLAAQAPTLSTTESSFSKLLDRIGGKLTEVRERLYDIAGQSVVDLTIAGITVWALARAAIRIHLSAYRRFFPDQISVYLIEPMIGSHGGIRASTRTISRLELDEVYKNDPKALRLVRRAQRSAARHPELPILFFPRGSSAEVFTNLNKHMSSLICGTDSALVSMNNATKRLASLASNGSIRPGIERQVPMQRVFLLYTFERYDAVRTRVVWLPADDVISLLGDLPSWTEACNRIKDEKTRSATRRRLTRHIEIATSIVLRRPDLVEGYCRNHPELWEKVQKTAQDMKKLLILFPEQSLEYLEAYIDPTRPRPNPKLTAKEEQWLSRIWYGQDTPPTDDEKGREWLSFIEIPSTRGDFELAAMPVCPPKQAA